MKLQVTSITSTSAAGVGNAQLYQSLAGYKTGLTARAFDSCDVLNTFTGPVAGLEHVVLPGALQAFNCRNNRLAYLGLQQDNFLESARQRVKKFGASRVGVFIGTSTSGIYETELAYRQMISQSKTQLPAWYDYAHSHNNYSVAEFVASMVGAEGMAHTVSTACSSSAKVFANAWRSIEAGFCDAAIVGGVDSLCLTTLFGFNSLQLVSETPCMPCDNNRQGISIGEAAGFAVLEPGEQGVMQFLGYGESSDAYHMSSPHPEGEGAFVSMSSALARAGKKADDIDYINMHGTGTRANDLSESRAINRLFGSALPSSSTKGWTGHTLGAAGILEASICYLALQNNIAPASLNTRELDSEIDISVVMVENLSRPMQTVMSNSFGFGGSNCSLVFGACND